MSKHRTFVPSGFSLRDVPYIFIGLLSIAAISAVASWSLGWLPPFWGGLICGLVIGVALTMYITTDSKVVDISKLTAPSEHILAKLDDPNCRFPSGSFARVVKMYCDETGTSLAEGTEILIACAAKLDSRSNTAGASVNS